MDKPIAATPAIEADGVRIAALDLMAASLRYFSATGAFAAAVRASVGHPLPQPLAAIMGVSGGAAQVILAWRGPTEALLLCNDRGVFDGIEQRVTALADGCLVNQTGGLRVFQLLGPRAPDLLQRMGAMTAVPAAGEARASRLAEVPVLTACVREREFLLCVERVYADHLIEWICATLADFSQEGAPPDP